MGTLTVTLGKLGKYDEAEEINRQLLKAKEITLGIQHLETLSSLSNLANVLTEQGKYEEAEEIHQKALEERERVLG
jgi:tetratricopeptide (TPR) repeat protein